MKLGPSGSPPPTPLFGDHQSTAVRDEQWERYQRVETAVIVVFLVALFVWALFFVGVLP